MQNPKLMAGLVLLGGVASPAMADAATQLEVGPSIALSNGSGEQITDLDLAAKVKLVRMGNGTLISVFADGAGASVYDVKAQATRPARDVFVRTCNPSMTDCEDESNWSPAVNVSHTAVLSSATTQWQGPAMPAEPYVGDSEKPNIFNNGPRAVVTWVDAYCPGGEQGSVSYLELDEREIPYHCTWAVVSTNNGMSWSAPQQLSDGSRDAKQDVSRGSDQAWVITWQEDPQGLQLGDAEGPGEGASGANVSHGTDIWYTYLTIGDLMAGASFPPAWRLTDNYTHDLTTQGMQTDVESGVAGASRANTALLGGTVLVAYEETKGTGGTDIGKYIRYHVFPYDQPPESCEPDPMGAPGSCLLGGRGQPIPAADDPARMGCILSEPAENARRVRFVTQGTPGMGSSIKLFIFWKQGVFDQGGPSDIVGRGGYFPAGAMGSAAGFRWQDLDPPIALPTATTLGDTPDGCLVRGDEAMMDGAFGNAPGINLSADTESGGSLDAGTSDNDIENALAHRAIIRGDFVAVGYSYTSDWAVATYTDQENYDFWVRTSPDGGATWTEPLDLTTEHTTALAATLGLDPTGVNVREPRLVKTPGNGPGCPSGDPMAPDTTNGEDCTSNVFFVAWGTQLNTYEHLGPGPDLDLFVTRSTNEGASYEEVQLLAAGGKVEELESQLRPTPDGNRLFAVWNASMDGATDALFAVATVEGEPGGETTGGETTGGDTDTDTDGDSDGDTDGVTSGSGTGAADSTGGDTLPGTTSSGSGTDGDGDGGSAQGGLDDGCACHASSGSGSGSGGAAALLGLGLLGLGRRRRRR